MKLAEIHVVDHGQVLTLEYAPGAPEDAPPMVQAVQPVATALLRKMPLDNKALIFKGQDNVWFLLEVKDKVITGWSSLDTADMDMAIVRAIAKTGATGIEFSPDKEADALLARALELSSKASGQKMTAEQGAADLAEILMLTTYSHVMTTLNNVIATFVQHSPEPAQASVARMLDAVQEGFKRSLGTPEMISATIRRNINEVTAQKLFEETLAEFEAKGQVKH